MAHGSSKICWNRLIVLSAPLLNMLYTVLHNKAATCLLTASMIAYLC